MKRNIIIATAAAFALIGGGTATAFAVAGEDSAQVQPPQTPKSVTLDDRDDSAADAKDDAKDDRDDDRDDRGDDRDESRDDDRDDDASQAQAAKVSAAQAISAALEHTKGTAVSADIDDDGPASWEVEVVTGKNTVRSIHIDPSSGKVINSHTEDDEDDAAEALALLKGSSTSALEAAKAGESKGTVTSVDLDDDGKGAWEVETAAGNDRERDWHVGLNSSKITADLDDVDHHGDDNDDDGDDD